MWRFGGGRICRGISPTSHGLRGSHGIGRAQDGVLDRVFGTCYDLYIVGNVEWCVKGINAGRLAENMGWAAKDTGELVGMDFGD